MWPKKKKGVKLSPGECMEINFLTSWRRDKEEVFIITEKGQIILGRHSELFVEVTADNIDPVKLQVIPDFKKKVLNFVEIIDPNEKKKFKNQTGPKLTFAGRIIKESDMSFGDYLKQWDNNVKDIEKMVNSSKWIRNIFIPLNILLSFWNFYLFLTNSNDSRYINLGVTIFTVYMIYYIYNSHRKLYGDYKKYKETREQAFGVVKEK